MTISCDKAWDELESLRKKLNDGAINYLEKYE